MKVVQILSETTAEIYEHAICRWNKAAIRYDPNELIIQLICQMQCGAFSSSKSSKKTVILSDNMLGLWKRHNFAKYAHAKYAFSGNKSTYLLIFNRVEKMRKRYDTMRSKMHVNDSTRPTQMWINNGKQVLMR